MDYKSTDAHDILSVYSQHVLKKILPESWLWPLETSEAIKLMECSLLWNFLQSSERFAIVLDNFLIDCHRSR